MAPQCALGSAAAILNRENMHMRTIFRWAPSRLIAGASVGVLALTLSTSNVWGRRMTTAEKENKTSAAQSESTDDSNAADSSTGDFQFLGLQFHGRVQYRFLSAKGKQPTI